MFTEEVEVALRALCAKHRDLGTLEIDTLTVVEAYFCQELQAICTLVLDSR